MLNTVIISASDPLLLKIENEKYYKRSIRGRKFCNFKNILRRGRYLVVRDIWVSYQMDKLFNSVEKSLFSSYFRETNLQFFDLEEI